jgi:hypothetical protein
MSRAVAGVEGTPIFRTLAESLFVFLAYGLKLDWEAAKKRTALQLGLY